jgi:hypothetical protein
MFVKTFENARNDQGGQHDFSGCHEAERWLDARGYSLGYMQGPSPRGILFGDYEIAKWRNLSAKEKAQLHGTMTGDMRNGPVSVALSNVDAEPAIVNPPHSGAQEG